MVKKRKWIPLLVLMVVLFAGIIGITWKMGHRADTGSAAKGSYSTDIPAKSDLYDAIYVQRVEYRNQKFVVLSDIMQRDEVQWVIYTPQSDNPAELSDEQYGDKIPCGVYISEYLTKEEYKKKIDGYSLFTASEDVITVILIKDGVGYVFSAVEAPGTDEKVVVKRFVKLASGELGIDCFSIHKNGERLKSYLELNHFQKYGK